MAYDIDDALREKKLRLRGYQKKYYNKNKERIYAYNKNYFQKNKKKIYARRKALEEERSS